MDVETQGTIGAVVIALVHALDEAGHYAAVETLRRYSVDPEHSQKQRSLFAALFNTLSKSTDRRQENAEPDRCSRKFTVITGGNNAA